MFRPIYEPRGRAQEYCDYALNIYRGCTHGCTYCYAPRIMRMTQEDFNNCRVRPGIVEATAAQLAKGGYEGKKIMLCFTCDPYPADIDTMPTREIIKLIKAAGANVQILTKGGMRAVRDFDLLGEGDSFGATLTYQYIDRHREPNAAHLHDRYGALAYAKELGLHTWVSFEPVVDVNVVYFAIKNSCIIDLYRIGKMNYHPSDINWAEFGRECERLCKEYGRNYYIKEDLRAEMERQVK